MRPTSLKIKLLPAPYSIDVPPLQEGALLLAKIFYDIVPLLASLSRAKKMEGVRRMTVDISWTFQEWFISRYSRVLTYNVCVFLAGVLSVHVSKGMWWLSKPQIHS